MIISCSSCNSKYLVNSADLKPSGRNVQCANCGNNWFQEPTFDEKEEIFHSTPSIQNEKNNKIEKNISSNLPSTYVVDEKASFLNSVLVLFIFLIFIFCFWVIKQNGTNFFVLINYYINEFYFNLRLIIKDLADIIYNIFN